MLKRLSAVLVLLAATLHGQQGTAVLPAILTPGPVQIVGRVVEAGSTTGVGGAVVTLSGGALGASTSVFTNGLAGGTRRVLTDGQGQFLFRDLPAGTYNLSSAASGYVDGVYGETRTITIRRTLDITRPLEVTDADKLVPVKIQMWKLGGISGRLLDEAGEPLVGANVNVFARVIDWGGPIMQLAANAATDDRGMYHVDVTPGDYVVAFHNATITSPMSVVAGVQQAMAEGDAALRRYLQQMPMSGDVSIARGVGVRVGNFTVMPRNNSVSALPPLMTIDGRLMLYASAYHPASLIASSAASVTVQSGEEKTGIDVHVPLIPARRVSGRITSPNGPFAGNGLLLIPYDAATLRTSPATLFDMPGATTDANGDYSFVGISPGRYLLRVFTRDDSGPTSPGLFWATATVTVPADSDIEGLDLTLKPGVRVSGRIAVDSPTGATPTPQQLRQISANARPLPGADEAFVLTDSPRAATHIDDVRFVCSPSIPGPHMMTIAGIPPGWVLKSVTSGGQNIVDKPFDLPANGLSDIVVTITDQVTTLNGVVRDANGNAVSTPMVAVFPQDKTLWPLPGMASRRVQTAVPGRDGRYTFRGLPAGDYIVVAVDGGSPDFSDPKILTELTTSGSRVSIADGEGRTQDLRVVVLR